MMITMQYGCLSGIDNKLSEFLPPLGNNLGLDFIYTLLLQRGAPKQI